VGVELGKEKGNIWRGIHPILLSTIRPIFNKPIKKERRSKFSMNHINIIDHSDDGQYTREVLPISERGDESVSLYFTDLQQKENNSGGKP
jgi:hypothetical protein